jgi:hypothetical protein
MPKMVPPKSLKSKDERRPRASANKDRDAALASVNKLMDRLREARARDANLPGNRAGTAELDVLVTELATLRDEVSILREKSAAPRTVNLPKVILPELHDKQSGRIDAQKVAEFMAIPLKQLADGLRLNYKVMHRTPSAVIFQEALRPVKRSLELLHEFFGPVETIRVWLNTPHPSLDGTTALETILEGKAFAVVRILENAWNGLPS